MNHQKFLFALAVGAFLLFSCQHIRAQNISLGLGAGVGKGARYPGVKVVSIMGVGEKYSFFDEPALAATSYTGYSRYETLGEEVIPFHTITFGAGARLYFMELFLPEKFADRKYQLYTEFTLAYDYVFSSAFYGLILESDLYVGFKLGGRYFLAERLGVFGEIGPSPSGYLNVGLVCKY